MRALVFKSLGADSYNHLTNGLDRIHQFDAGYFLKV